MWRIELSTIFRSAAWIVLVLLPALAHAVDALQLAMRDDASLSDVCFVDAEHGWAVGDRGAIWQTSDGGRRWLLQESGVDCRLTSVQFIDKQHGWAAGGFSEPFSHVSHAVLLRTRDGGKTWNAIPQPLLGAVLRLRFIDGRHGWAVCVPNGLCPGGVAMTDDGGQDWTPLAQQSVTPWACGDFIDREQGALAADGGTAATVHRGECRPGRLASGIRRLAMMKLAGDGHGYLVGEGGLVLTTPDGGLRWQQCSLASGGPTTAAPRCPPPVDSAETLLTAETIDFKAIALLGDDVWIAGSPGALVIHSSDRGRTWQAHSTGTTLPIESLTFVDVARGWAVGALGQILATTDGGRTWQVQRGAGRRAAYLAVFGEAGDVPLTALARLTSAEGYRGAVSLVARRDLESPLHPPLTARLREREALLAAGASEVSGAWEFPLRQAGVARSAEQMVEDWQRATGEENPLARLEERLVREIHCWRPEIVVTHAANASAERPLERQIHQAVLRAVKRVAAEEKVAIDRDFASSRPPVTAGGAVPARVPGASQAPPQHSWHVRRVLATVDVQQHSAFSLSAAQVLPQLGHSLAESTAAARGLFSQDAEPAADSISFAVAWDQSPANSNVRDFFSGLVVRAPSEARRAPLPEVAASLEQLRRMAQRRQALAGIVAHQAMVQRGRGAWLAQIGTLTRDLDDASAAQLLYQLGCQYRESGQTTLAAETFTQLVEKYPTQPGAAAALWLLQYYSSAEMGLRAEQAGASLGPLADQQASATVGEPPRTTASLIPATEEAPATAGAKDPPISGGANGTREPGKAAALRSQLAAQWSQRLQQISAHLAAEPRAILPAASAAALLDSRSLPLKQRQSDNQRLPSSGTGPDNPSQRLLVGLMRSRPSDAWWSCAASEHWLSNPQEQRAAAPKPIWTCRRTAQKPRLDGRLDETCWRGTEGVDVSGIELRSGLGDDGTWPATVQAAYDEEFLYFAVTCRQAAGVKYAATGGPRQRDANISEQDRVALMLDTDRDWTSYWRLAVDHRGQTAEDCWGDPTWNPQWFVATAKQHDTWTCEAAIPLAELTLKAPRRGDVWAAGVERVVPGAGFQSWNTPASAATVRPEGFGLLRFE